MVQKWKNRIKFIYRRNYNIIIMTNNLFIFFTNILQNSSINKMMYFIVGECSLGKTKLINQQLKTDNDIILYNNVIVDN